MTPTTQTKTKMTTQTESTPFPEEPELKACTLEEFRAILEAGREYVREMGISIEDADS